MKYTGIIEIEGGNKMKTAQVQSELIYRLTEDLNESELEARIYELIGRDLLHKYVIKGYNDTCAGYYDKWYRYNTNCEDEYLVGSLLAQKRGYVINNIIECS